MIITLSRYEYRETKAENSGITNKDTDTHRVPDTTAIIRVVGLVYQPSEHGPLIAHHYHLSRVNG